MGKPAENKRRPTRLGPFGPPRLQYLPYSIFVSGETRGFDILKYVGTMSPARRRATPLLMSLEHQQYDKYMFDPPLDEPPKVRIYESTVRKTMDRILETEIGKCLFKSMYNKVAIWVRPWLDDGSGYCNAQTGAATNMSVGVQYSPETWDMNHCGGWTGNSPEEVLFHELVHASRYSNYGVDDLQNDPLELMKNGEEFLAVMVTNSFIAERKGTKFNRDYMTSTDGTKDEVYGFLSSKKAYVEMINTLLLEEDPLIKLIDKLPMSFNVFRDFHQLKDAFEQTPAGHLNKLFNPVDPLNLYPAGN